MRESHSCNNHDPDLFRKVKDAVTMQQVVEFYGMQMDRRGLILCPFHQDKNPSLKVYPDGKGFYCFTCGAGGDQIKFAAMYRDVGNYEAAKELAAAFHVPVMEPVSYRERREAELVRRRRTAVAAFAKEAKMYLTAYYGLLCEAVRLRSGHFFEGIQNREWVLYMLEQVQECPDQVMKDQKAVKRIGEIEGRIGDWYFAAESNGTVPGRDILSDF